MSYRIVESEVHAQWRRQGAIPRVTKIFFISFTGKDKAWAEWIAYELEAAGYQVIIQSWDFHAGNNIAIMMDKALKQAERVIAVISAAYFQSSFTPSEWGAAFMLDPKGENSRLVPICIEDCEIPPGLLRAIAHINIHGYSEEGAREKLLKGIRRERNKPTRAPAFPGTAKQALVASDTQQAKPPFPGPASPSQHKTASPEPKPDTTNSQEATAEGDDKVKKVFFSYADQDRDMLEELERHLAPYKRKRIIECWIVGLLKC